MHVLYILGVSHISVWRVKKKKIPKTTTKKTTPNKQKNIPKPAAYTTPKSTDCINIQQTCRRATLAFICKSRLTVSPVFTGSVSATIPLAFTLSSPARHKVTVCCLLPATGIQCVYHTLFCKNECLRKEYNERNEAIKSCSVADNQLISMWKFDFISFWRPYARNMLWKI